jgi:hypothetical protein
VAAKKKELKINDLTRCFFLALGNAKRFLGRSNQPLTGHKPLDCFAALKRNNGLND